MFRGPHGRVVAILAAGACVAALSACSGGAQRATPAPAPDGSNFAAPKPAGASSAGSAPAPPGAVAPIVVSWQEPDRGQPQPPGLSQLPMCRASDLEFNDGDSNGAGGSIYLSVIIVNRTGPPCRLHGTPSVELLDMDGLPTALVTKPASPSPNGFDVLLSPTTAPFRPGLQIPPNAALQLVWRSSVNSCPGGYLAFHEIRLHLPDVHDPGVVSFSGNFRHTVCADVTVGVGAVTALIPQRPSSESGARISVTLKAPGQVSPGQLVAYTVQLANWTHDDLTAPEYCPAFIQLLVPTAGRDSPVAEPTGRALSCDGLPSLPIAGIVVFEIHFPIPADAQLGSYNLVWAPVPGPHISGQASARVNIEKPRPTATPTR